jgi:hypothetical protein
MLLSRHQNAGENHDIKVANTVYRLKHWNNTDAYIRCDYALSHVESKTLRTFPFVT